MIKVIEWLENIIVNLIVFYLRCAIILLAIITIKELFLCEIPNKEKLFWILLIIV